MDEERGTQPKAGDVVDEVEVEGHRLVLQWIEVPDDPVPGAGGDAGQQGATAATGQTQPGQESEVEGHILTGRPPISID